jgi:hypothetical protein
MPSGSGLAAGQHLDEAAVPERGAEDEARLERDAEAGLGGAAEAVAVVGGEPPAGPDLALLAVRARAASTGCRSRGSSSATAGARRDPRRSPACRRGRGSSGPRRDAGRDSARRLARRLESARVPIRTARSKPSATISTKRSSSTRLISTSGYSPRKSATAPREVRDAEADRGRHAQRAARRRLHRGDHVVGLGRVFQHGLGAVVVGKADLGRADPAGRAVEQPHREPRFERGDVL